MGNWETAMSVMKTSTIEESQICIHLRVLKAANSNLYLYRSNNPQRNLKNSRIRTDTKVIFILSAQIMHSSNLFAQSNKQFPYLKKSLPERHF